MASQTLTRDHGLSLGVSPTQAAGCPSARLVHGDRGDDEALWRKRLARLEGTVISPHQRVGETYLFL